MLAGSGGGWGWRMVACQPGSAIREPVRYYHLALRKLYSFETGENELPKHTRMDGWLIAIAQTRHTSENENDIAHTTDGHTHTFNKKRVEVGLGMRGFGIAIEWRHVLVSEGLARISSCV